MLLLILSFSGRNRAGGQTKQLVKRTRTHQSGQGENSRHDQRDDAYCTCQRTAEIKKNSHCCEEEANDAVGRTHVLFHKKVDCKMIKNVESIICQRR